MAWTGRPSFKSKGESFINENIGDYITGGSLIPPLELESVISRADRFGMNSLFTDSLSNTAYTPPVIQDGVQDSAALVTEVWLEDSLPISSDQSTNSVNLTLSFDMETEFPAVLDGNVTSSPVFPEYIKLVSTVACSIVLFVGVIGNTLVPVVILKNPDMRNSTNYFLVNLSLADLLVLLVCLPSVMVELHSPPDVWVLGSTMCKIVPFVEYMVVHGSALSLMVISLERYYVIVRPLQAGYRSTRSKAATAVAVVWTTALISAGLMLWIQKYQLVRYYDDSSQPVCITEIGSFWARLYLVTSSMMFFFVPLFLLVILYTTIAKQLLADTCDLTLKKEHPQIKARRQVVIMLATVIIFYFLCILPMRVLFLWILSVPRESVLSLGVEAYYNILYFCRIMFYINSSINPILYNMTSTKFRSAFVRVFAGRRKWRHQDTFTSNHNYTSGNNHRLMEATNSYLLYESGGRTGIKYQGSRTSYASSHLTRNTSLASPAIKQLSNSFI